jgi:hypothetical protein
MAHKPLKGKDRAAIVGMGCLWGGFFLSLLLILTDVQPANGNKKPCSSSFFRD